MSSWRRDPGAGSKFLVSRRLAVLILVALAGWLVSACNSDPAPASPTNAAGQPTATRAGPTAPPTDTAVPPTPTPTPEPPVANVNGQQITLAEYSSHLQRLELSLTETGTEMATEEKRERVLKDLIDQLLLAQAAAEAGFSVDQQTVDERIESLAAQVGGAAGLEAWQQAHAYSPESFRQDLARAIAAAWMRDNIIAGVPDAAEQVYARQILLYNAEDASAVLNELNAGGDFEVLARVNDPQGFGELGWFPRGFLMVPEIEAAAFAMQPGELSEVIESPLGFHILKVVDRSETRPLEPQARYELQLMALQNWLAERRAASEIEILPAP
ncbi:MAG: peptidylprolyl isomerase [Anaerolineales bacterium]|nr:peptidylprolyl isomerase [Anaerolineales bacterium]